LGKDLLKDIDTLNRYQMSLTFTPETLLYISSYQRPYVIIELIVQ